MPPSSTHKRTTPAGPATRARRRGRPATDASEAVSETHVLDAAFEAFAQRGYEGTTLRELAKQLGVSHNLLNVRFGAKADLWRRAVDARVARIAPPVFAIFEMQGLAEDARLAALLRQFCRWAADNPDFVGLVHTEGRRATWRLEYLVNAYVLPFKQRLEDLLASIAARRPVRPLSSSALMAIMVEGVGFYFASGPLLACMGRAEEIAPHKLDDQVASFADFILAGLLPPYLPAGPSTATESSI
jgi:AcrR family transcriptional regulator